MNFPIEKDTRHLNQRVAISTLIIGHLGSKLRQLSIAWEIQRLVEIRKEKQIPGICSSVALWRNAVSRSFQSAQAVT